MEMSNGAPRNQGRQDRVDGTAPCGSAHLSDVTVVEIARSKTLEVEGHVPVPGRTHSGNDLVPAVDDSPQPVGRDLDSCQLLVVLDPQVVEAEGAP